MCCRYVCSGNAKECALVLHNAIGGCVRSTLCVEWSPLPGGHPLPTHGHPVAHCA